MQFSQSQVALPDPSDLPAVRATCAETILRMYKRANAGHIGSSLSCLEILVDLCFSRAASDDMIVLSKGHAAAALYATLSLSGRMPGIDLESFYQEGTHLAAHPSCAGAIPAIPFGTGSLGHGLSLGAGVAISQRFTGRNFHVYVILSDGDCNEGSTWEAAMFAAHHKLNSLTVVVDLNGIQGIGFSRDILQLDPVATKWKSLGFAVAEVPDGNDFGCLAQAYEQLRNSSGPRCIVAHTVKGHGVSYMEDRVEWHYLPMNEEQFETALRETAERRSTER